MLGRCQILKKILIKNGYVIDPKTGKDGHKDILISDGKIEKISESIDADACRKEVKGKNNLRVVDAEGLLVAPGLVDVHVHFRDPGFTEKEDIYTGAKAAAKGGFTSVVMMANTKPAIDSVDTLEYVLNKGKETAINVYACGNVTMGLKGEELTDMDALAQAGAVGFTDDGIPLVKEDIVKKAMEKCAQLDMPISFHEEDPSVIENNGINRGKASEFFGIGGSPRQAEINMIARDIKLAEGLGTSIDIQHISTKEGVQLVREAKASGMSIHAEATPHHFSLTEEAAIEHGTLAKMNPPLREEADRRAIIAGLVDETIDMIATDHAPHTAEEKARELTKAPSGIIGLETALPLGITNLVDAGYMTINKLIKLMSTNPAAVYHLDAGYIAEGGPADIILIDTRVSEIYEKENIASKACNTPFIGCELKGKVMMTICRGEVAYEA